MRALKLAIVIASFAIITSATNAADLLPLKAPPSPFINTTGGSGWFLTVGTGAAVAQSSVTGNNLFATSLVGGNLNAAGATVIGGFGYISNGGPTGWYMLTNDVAYQNIRGSLSNGAGAVQSNWTITQEACAGAELFQTLASILPNLNTSFPTFTPVAPVGAVGTPRQCFGAVSREFQMSGSFGAASGQTWGWEPGASMHYIWEAAGTSGKPTGGAWDVSMLVAFPLRGATFGNVLATNGAPLTIGSGANLGTQYEARITYHFVP